jgi:hypothetical protein
VPEFTKIENCLSTFECFIPIQASPACSSHAGEADRDRPRQPSQNRIARMQPTIRNPPRVVAWWC